MVSVTICITDAHSHVGLHAHTDTQPKMFVQVLDFEDFNGLLWLLVAVFFLGCKGCSTFGGCVAAECCLMFSGDDRGLHAWVCSFERGCWKDSSVCNGGTIQQFVDIK